MLAYQNVVNELNKNKKAHLSVVPLRL